MSDTPSFLTASQDLVFAPCQQLRKQKDGVEREENPLVERKQKPEQQPS
jgi:hypothetical protein